MSQRTDPHRLRYQPALDGLRAVAVLAVMIFHAGAERLQGGFLGVDLFFVLSGFLITTLLLREHAATGGIGFAEFYARRVRRLLPALLLVLVAVVVYAQTAGPPFSRRSVRLDALASLFYVANWRFIFSQQPYFASAVEPSPLRHVWSLAIEEQWYLLWPVVLVGLLRLCRHRRGALGAIIAVLAAASSAWMAYLTRGDVDPSRAYYGLFSHAFVLLAGALLAVALHGERSSVEPRPSQRVLAEVLGFASIAVVLAYFVNVGGQDRWLYQGGYLGFTLAGVAIIYVAMLPGRGLLQRVLAVGPLAWVGRISYGLYLWHWPIDIWLNPSRFDWSPQWLLAVRLAAAFAAATLSYYLVEHPIRTANWSRFTRPRLLTAGATVLSMAVMTGVVLVGIRPPEVAPTLPWGGTSETADTPRPQRPTPIEPGKLRVLLLGDSVGFTQGYGAGPATASIIPGAHIGCGLIPFSGKTGDDVLIWDRQATVCEGLSEDWAFGAAQDPDVIVLVAGAWEVYDRRIDGRTYRVGTDAYARLLTENLESVRLFFAARTAAPLVIEDVPCMRPTEYGLGSKQSPRADDAKVAWLNKVFGDFAAAYPGRVSILPISDYVCPDGEFRDEIDGQVVRPDGAHYNPLATTALWDWIVPRLLDLPGVSVGHPAPGGATR